MSTEREQLAGRLLKEIGQQAVERSNDGFVQSMREVAETISNINGEVTSDDLREYAAARGLKPNHPNAWGSIFRGKHWTVVGRVTSKIDTNHAREIRVWVYTP